MHSERCKEDSLGVGRATLLNKVGLTACHLAAPAEREGKLQGYLAVGHCRSAAGMLGGWALQGYFAVGRCKDTHRLGTARMPGG